MLNRGPNENGGRKSYFPLFYTLDQTLWTGEREIGDEALAEPGKSGKRPKHGI